MASCKDLINFRGKFPVFISYGIPGIMGAEAYSDTIIHVGPIRVMVYFLSGKSHFCHKRKSINKVVKLKVTGQLVIFFVPHGV